MLKRRPIMEVDIINSPTACWRITGNDMSTRLKIGKSDFVIAILGIIGGIYLMCTGTPYSLFYLLMSVAYFVVCFKKKGDKE